jgi:processive 1,2-diacylglycerol beta-glucosyltransferase
MSPDRVLILSAPIGGSHDQMARATQASLARCGRSIEPILVSSISTHGAILEWLVLRPARVHIERVGWSYDTAYRLSTSTATGWRMSSVALRGLAAVPLRRLITALQPSVVVSTYPMTTTVLGHLRRQRRLSMPVCAVVGPLGGLRPWCARGVDRHLVLYPQARAQVARLCGEHDVQAIRPLVDDQFFDPLARDQARHALGLPERPLILISGGAWGAGDLDGAVAAALRLGKVGVVVVTGRNEARAEALARRYAGRPVRVIGFTREMHLLLAAADVFVTATSGLSCLEAQLRGCPTISYGLPVAHVLDNARALAAAGYVCLCGDTGRLTALLAEALAGSWTPPPCPADLPEAGALIAQLMPEVAAVQGAR